MSEIQKKIVRHTPKKQEKTTHWQDRKQSTEQDSELSQILELKSAIKKKNCA